MNTRSLIEGLTILSAYYNNPDSYNTGADHDIIYATDRPVSSFDVARLRDLGWFQENGAEDEYDPSESWSAYV